MKCYACSGPLKVKKNQNWLYVESGLDNVILVGIDVEECANCSARNPILPALDELHLIIGMDLVRKATTLNGPEVRFLRKNLGMQANVMATVLAITPESLSRIENRNAEVNQQLDRMIRAYWVDKRMPDLEKLAALIRDRKRELKNQLKTEAVQGFLRRMKRPPDLSEVISGWASPRSSDDESPIQINVRDLLVMRDSQERGVNR